MSLLASVVAFLAPVVGFLGETKREPLKYDGPPHPLNDFIAWLETKPENGTYRWHSTNCLFGQYGKERKLNATPRASGGYNAAISKIGHNMGPAQEPYNIALPRPWTYGAALDRAYKARAEFP